MIYLKSLLTEIVSNPIIELGKYLQTSKEDRGIELAYDIFSDSIYDWMEDNHSDVKLPDYDTSSDVVEWINQKDPQIFKQFVAFVMKKAETVDLYDHTRAGHPSWNYMEFRGYLKNQWLIHFSDNAENIWLDQQFKFGMDDYTSLGLTTYYQESGKQFGGYNFAYDIGDFVRYGRSRFSSRGWKYGKEAVIFRASGVKVFHFGDQEPQVIFWGKTAKDIVYIQNTNENDWGVENDRNSNYIFREDLPQVVKWVVKNFNQYKNVLLPVRSITFPNKKNIYTR